jgi:S-adenosylmethionine-diacylgycerolhomoserine-N-methlytransferase
MDPVKSMNAVKSDRGNGPRLDSPRLGVLGPSATLGDYYKLHAHVYDATRWAFLFGRSMLIREAARRARSESLEVRRILEIGCGTGINLELLARLFPQAEIMGVDLSEDMLTKAHAKVARFEDRVTLRECAYSEPLSSGLPFDLIVFSYCLSMINPGYLDVLRVCRQDLAPQGKVAIVDFHDTPVGWFGRWMGLNHVRMDGQILAALQKGGWQLEPLHVERAYGGLWRWIMCFASR